MNAKAGTMPEEDAGRYVERDCPSLRNGFCLRTGGGIAFFQSACQHDQPALTGNHCEAVEGVADAHKIGLPPLVEGEHVEPVGGNVVRGGTERQ